MVDVRASRSIINASLTQVREYQDNINGCWKAVSANSRAIIYIVGLITPIVLLPLALSPYKIVRCTYVVLWMGIYWMLEPVDIAATALLPIALLPLLGILGSQRVCQSYMRDALMMFFGSLAVAAAVENSRLHERIALYTLASFGTNPKWLMCNVMMITMFVSMWISNAATAAMMVPLVNAIIDELRMKNTHSEDEIRQQKLKKLNKTLLLGVAYSASCGGLGTLVGSAPNMVYKGLLEKHYPESKEVTYLNWMLYNIPGMILCEIAAWCVLRLLHPAVWEDDDVETELNIGNIVKNKYQHLGSITFHEAVLLLQFVVLILLWVFKEPQFIIGWADLLTESKDIGLSAPVLMVVFLMFLTPTKPKEWRTGSRVLEWHILQDKMRWGIIILTGGGYAMAQGMQVAGLTKWICDKMFTLKKLPPYLLLTIICFSSSMLTEFITNTALTAVLVPVALQLAHMIKVNPIYLSLPVIITSSYAFMLPVATGPNAIVFDRSDMRVLDMLLSGFIMKLCACLIQLLLIHSYGAYMFNLHVYPKWANRTNQNFDENFVI